MDGGGRGRHSYSHRSRIRLCLGMRQHRLRLRQIGSNARHRSQLHRNPPTRGGYTHPWHVLGVVLVNRHRRLVERWAGAQQPGLEEVLVGATVVVRVVVRVDALVDNVPHRCPAGYANAVRNGRESRSKSGMDACMQMQLLILPEWRRYRRNNGHSQRYAYGHQ